MAIIKIAGIECPTCKTVVDGLNGVGHGRGPGPGDLTVCVECGSMWGFEFDRDGEVVAFRNPTIMEMVACQRDNLWMLDMSHEIMSKRRLS